MYENNKNNEGNEKKRTIEIMFEKEISKKNDENINNIKNEFNNEMKKSLINSKVNKENEITSNNEKKKLILNNIDKSNIKSKLNKNIKNENIKNKYNINNNIKKEQNNLSFDKKEKSNNNNNNNDEFSIPIQRRKTLRDDFFLDDNFFNNKNKDFNMKQKKIKLIDMLPLHELPFFLIERNKKKEVKENKKYVVEFVDTYNDDFVKKNINSKEIFESIQICKGISYININQNINNNCIGMKDNAFYYYNMIPFRLIYSKDNINKIINKQNNIDIKKKEIEQAKDEKYKNGQNDIQKNNNESKEKNSFMNRIYFSKIFEQIKKHFYNKKEEKIYNDLYLLPFENHLKSSICIGTHIFSNERAVKRCYGISIERNIYNHMDKIYEVNKNIHGNLENLHFDFVYSKNNIIFKPIFYPFKNKKIVDNSFKKYLLKNIKQDKFNKLTELQFYIQLKKNIFNFSKQVYFITKQSINHFDSPKDFIIQTSKKIQDINIRMKKICEKSFYLTYYFIMKLNTTYKTS